MMILVTTIVITISFMIMMARDNKKIEDKLGQNKRYKVR